ncbi:MAG: DUF4837 family protein [Odoribacter sp.]|nr:DUF4837 family protein [Odoribacter sp.]MDY3033626.1 DUF4837 family protein [Odoribacter sp.]
MRKVLAILLMGLLLGSGLISCKEGGGRKAALQAVTGSVNEILVITPKVRWDGPIGDSIRAYFGQPQMGLPQGEPVFDLISLPMSNFDKTVKAHRNVLIVSLKSSVDTASITYSDSPWARSQKVFRIVAPTEEAFYKVFDANKEKIMRVFLAAERDRLIDIYKSSPNTKVFDTFRDEYDMLLYCPGGYNINKDTADFVWASYETRVDSRGFIFFEEPYESVSQLEYQVILDEVNEKLKQFIPGPLDSTWMALDMVTPMTAANYQYAGKHYAWLIKGLWQVENDYMGGPFVLNVVLDQKNNRVLYMMGYVYAPDGKKRNLLRQVESIVYSMNIDLPEEEEKE